MSDSDEERSAPPQSPGQSPAQIQGQSPAEAEPTPTSAPARARAWRIGRVLLAPVLAASAVGVHFVLNVPKELPPPPADPSSKPKPKPKKKAPRETEPTQVRSKAELEQAASRYAGTAFEKEPVDTKWARRTKVVLNRAVVVAREAAFEGAPEQPRVVVTAIECKTVRCRMVIRSPYEHEVQLMEKALQRMLTDGVPLWSAFESAPKAPATADPPKPKRPNAPPKTPEVAVEVMVTLAADDVDVQGLSVAKAQAGEQVDTRDRREKPAKD